MEVKSKSLIPGSLCMDLEELVLPPIDGSLIIINNSGKDCLILNLSILSNIKLMSSLKMGGLMILKSLDMDSLDLGFVFLKLRGQPGN